MEIQRMLRGENISFASSARLARKTEETTEESGRPSTDRVELTRQLVQQMDEQRARLEAAMLSGKDPEEKKSGGILDMLDTSSAEEEELDAMSKDLDAKMKCLKIAMNIMKGKKVPPEDERYLMENDPDGYKLAMAMRRLVKEDDEECESVLDDEDKESGETLDTSEAESASGGGESASSGGEAATSSSGNSGVE